MLCLDNVLLVIQSHYFRFSFLGSYGVSKKLPDASLHKFHALEVVFPPKYFLFLLQLFKAANIWYFSQARDYCPSIWGELK